MATVKWVAAGKQNPPVKEPLLLIVSAAGSPPDAQLMDQSEVDASYWSDEKRFR
jgi:hypothetical protein